MLVAPHLSFLGRLLPCRASPMYLVSTPTRCRVVWRVSWRFVGGSPGEKIGFPLHVWPAKRTQVAGGYIGKLKNAMIHLFWSFFFQNQFDKVRPYDFDEVVTKGVVFKSWMKS